MNSSLNSASPVIWPQRANADLLLLHVHQEVREPLVLRRVRVGARHEHAPLRLVGERRPHLLAGDDPLVAVPHRARLQRGEVRAGLGLREPLAPDLLRGQDRRQVALALLLGAVRDHGRPAHREPEHVRGLRRARADDLLVEDRLLDQGRAAAAVLLRPRDAGPARRRSASAAMRGGTRSRCRRPPAPCPGGWPRATPGARPGTPPRR